MFDEIPSIRDPQALTTVFEMARQWTGSFSPEDRSLWLEWLDELQGVKQQRATYSAQAKAEREVAVAKTKTAREEARQAKADAKAAVQAQRYADRARRYVERQEAITRKAVVRREAQAKRISDEEQARLLAEERAKQKARRDEQKRVRAGVRAKANAVRELDRDLTHRARLLRELEPGPRCQLCREPGHSKTQCRFEPSNNGDPVHEPYEHKPLWRLSLEMRGSLKLV